MIWKVPSNSGVFGAVRTMFWKRAKPEGRVSLGRVVSLGLVCYQVPRIVSGIIEALSKYLLNE